MLELPKVYVRELDSSVENPNCIYHAGPGDQETLRADTKKVWGRISDHVHFLASENGVRELYGDDGNVIYVMDVKNVPSSALVVTDSESLWYDEIVDLEGLSRRMKEKSITDVREVVGDPDLSDLKKYLELHKVKTYEDVLRRLEKAKEEWFEKNTRPFNPNHIERYRISKRVIMVPGPILVE